ncbi:MAG: NAD-dependent epimerase/dehydratase family protein [Oscillochloridaceae bacterium umkhey_bin13]
MTCYLIAGASGYVGSRLATQLLANGQRVRGLVRNPDTPTVERLAALGLTVWIGNLTQPESLIGIAEGVSYVYNLTSCLAIAGEAAHQTYVYGNQHLLAACSRARSVRGYLFTSSVAPYGNAGEDLVSEDHPVQPTHPLAATLLAAEQTIMRVAREHRFPATVLRCGSIYGPERDPVEAVSYGLTMLYGDGRNFVSHIHIDDLIAVLLAMPTYGQPGAIYNVADDEPVRQRELVGAVRQRLGMVPPRSHSPAAALAAGLDPSIVGMLSASVRLDNRRLKHDLPIRLRYPSMRVWLDERLPHEAELAIGV